MPLPGDARPVRRVPPHGRLELVALSSGIVRPRAEIADGSRMLHDRGLEVGAAARLLAADGDLAGPDAGRAADLAGALRDPAVDAVWLAKGGWGAARALPHLDPGAARESAKAVLGMSDATLLHLWLSRAGVVSFWGPLCSQLGHSSAWTADRVVEALVTGGAPREVPHAPSSPPPVPIRPGVAEGVLVGGTATMLAHSLGTPWQARADGALLLLEDVGQAFHRVDRVLWQLVSSGLLDRVAGIVVGEYVECAPRPGGPSRSLHEILAGQLRPLGVPVLYGLPLGHGRDICTVPLGVPARLDAGAGSLVLLEDGLAP